MSGPVAPTDAGPQVDGPPAPGPGKRDGPPAVEVLEGRSTEVGGLPVIRSLPQRRRRTIGAWCFVDHFGPADASMQVGPHPHIGLHTVTWVLDGEVLHRDTLGSEQLIRPGQLNVMTAGRGVAHAEETPEASPATLHGLQLWVAQPEATRSGPAAFEHHAGLPRAEVGAAEATVLVGDLAGARSPARADTPMLGADLVVTGPTALPLDAAFEHGVLVIDGPLTVDGQVVAPGGLAYLAPGRDEIGVAPGPGSGGTGRRAGRALLLGGTPWAETLLMWWNFVARTPQEMDAARRAWEDGSDRFGTVDSGLGPIPAPAAPAWWGIATPAK